MFKKRANLVKEALDANADHSFMVKVNETKPRKGAFVVSMEGTEAPIVELLGLVRPFPKLRALDMDKVVEDVFTAAACTK